MIGRLGTVDVDDLLALLDAALDRWHRPVPGRRDGRLVRRFHDLLVGLARRRAFRAAISERAVNAWDSFTGSSDIGYYFAAPTSVPIATSARIPLAYADNITCRC